MSFPHGHRQWCARALEIHTEREPAGVEGGLVEAIDDWQRTITRHSPSLVDRGLIREIEADRLSLDWPDSDIAATSQSKKRSSFLAQQSKPDRRNMDIR